MVSLIDDILQPIIQLIFIISIIITIINIRYPQKMKSNSILMWFNNNSIVLYMIAGAAIYHYFILPILFVHEFNGYEGFDYRHLLQNDMGEPVNNFILFRKDKHSPLEAITLLVNTIKNNSTASNSTDNILKNTLGLKNDERINTLKEKIDKL